MGRPLLVIAGPTAVGKSDVAAMVAGDLGWEIVCADSRQLYGGIPIGSASPSAEAMKKAPHHLFGVLSPDRRFSAGEYREVASRVIDEIHARRKVPILVGGSGLYIQALTGGLVMAPPATEETVKRLNERVRMEGAQAVWEELKRVDSGSAESISANDTHRIVRALAVFLDTGRTISESRGIESGPYSPVAIAVLEKPRDELYQRINLRSEEMLRAGMLEEAAGLRGRGLGRDAPAVRAIGYAHLFRHLDGEIGLREALTLMQRDSRRYAKRQLTWFRGREKRALWFRVEEPGETARRVSHYFRLVLG